MTHDGPDRPERANGQEHPELVKRAGRTNQADMEERAALREDPEVSERADDADAPEVSDRAGSYDSTEDAERAGLNNDTERFERVGVSDEPDGRERAGIRDDTGASERAGADDEPAKPDRPYRPRSLLRIIADSYEQAQRIRIETGERIRAVLQGKDETFAGDVAHWRQQVQAMDPVPVAWLHGQRTRSGKDRSAADYVLDAIAAGQTLGPVPVLGRTFRTFHGEERALFKDMSDALEPHPAWPWISRVKGVGPTLACKLLARLDPERAQSPSAFWRYCGLSTVPGNSYRCDTCGLERGWPVGYNVTGTHTALDSTRKCKGALVLVAGPDDGIHVAEPRPARGQKASYDRQAKKICYLIGVSFEKQGRRSAYGEYYRDQLARLIEHRPNWPAGRIRFTALRCVEKLFLSHLWLVWRTAVGLPIREPYVYAHLEHDRAFQLTPEMMVES